ncbi:MAG: PilZ domain-containing protein, partial [Vicinamibacteria bacterium]
MPSSAPKANLDRRKYPRIASDQIISYMEIDAEPARVKGKDVSLSGIRFEVVGCELTVDSIIRLNFWVGTEPITAVG